MINWYDNYDPMYPEWVDFEDIWVDEPITKDDLDVLPYDDTEDYY